MKQQDKEALKRYQTKLDFAMSSGGADPFETNIGKEARKTRAKKDPRFMIEYYFPHYAESPNADFQMEFMQLVKKYKTFKGFCEWGRALAKSVICDIFLPFWLWINTDFHG